MRLFDPIGAAVRGKRLSVLTSSVLGAMLLGFGLYCATHSVDFPVYHRIARQILRGDYEIYPSALYDGGPIPAHGFRYMPAIAFLFVPFGFLPLDAAAFLFFVLKAGAVMYVGSVVARHVGWSGPSRNLMLASLLFVAGYAIEEFRYGNFHFFCVALMVLAFDSAEAGRVVTPAAALAVAIAAKLTPLLLLAHFAWRRRFAVCVVTVLLLASIAVLPAAFFGYETNNHLLEGFAKYAVQKMDEGDNYALLGVLRRSALSAETVPRVWLLALMSGGIVVAAALRRKPEQPTTRLLEFSVVLTAMLLASPHTQRRYFVALYVPIMTLLAMVVKDPTRPDGRLVRFALAVTAAVGTILPLLFSGRWLAIAYEACSPYFFGALALFITLVFLTARLTAAEQP